MLALTTTVSKERIMADVDFKVCSVCKESKPRSEFHSNKNRKDGLCSMCKPCNCAHAKAGREKVDHSILKAKKSAYYAINRDKLTAAMRENRLKNIDAVREKDRERGKLRSKDSIHQNYLRRADAAKASAKIWAANNPEKRRQISASWRGRNKDAVNFWDATRNAAEKNATPVWANEFFMAEAYHLAKLREKICGGKWHVDHIVPLQSKLVCGLHVEHNLQVIPASDNIRKSNRYWPDMP